MTAIHRALKHRTRAVVALLLVALAGLTLAACGGDDNDGGSSGGGDAADARAILRDTFSGTDDIRSADVDVRLRITANEDGESFAIGVGGPFQTRDGADVPEFDMELDADLGQQGQFRAGLVSVDGRLFVEWMDDAYEVPGQLLDQVRTTLEQQQRDGTATESLSAYGIDPQTWVDDPEVVGQEDVGGTETDHVAGTLNVGAFLDSVDRLLAEVDRQGLAAASGQDVPDRIPADDRAQIERSIRNARVDVWSGTDDKTLRKLQVAVDVAPEGDETEGGRIEFTLEFDGVNEEQSITAPANTRPIDQLLGQFQGLLGGGLGGGAGAGGGSGSGDLDEYQDCLVRAAGDVRAAQRCASLLR